MCTQTSQPLLEHSYEKTVHACHLPAAIATVAVGVSTAQAQSLLVNGDFELPGFSAPPYYRYMANGDSSTMTSWTVINDGIGEAPYLMHAGYPAYDATGIPHGTYAVALNQGSGLRTTFPIVGNTIYELSFWVRPGEADGPGHFTPDPLAVQVAGVTANIPPTSSGWSYHTLLFTTPSSDPAAVLEFLNPSPVGDFRGWAIDAVAVTTVVPEPAWGTLAMAGLAGLWVWHSRRDRRARP